MRLDAIAACAHWHAAVALGAVSLLMGTFAGATSSAAQSIDSELPTNSYVTPFPQGEVYRLHVFGDRLRTGLRSALEGLLADEPRVRVTNATVAINSLISSRWDQTVLEIENGEPRLPIDIAVVILGTGDRGSLREAGRARVPYGSADWKPGYAIRVGRLMTALKKRKAAVYWVGLPIMRGPRTNAHAATINEIVRDQALRNRMKFINIYETFAGENGGYTPYGPDLAGEVRSLRRKDGVNFTTAGYEKVAHFVKQEIERDLRQAQSERMVELRGSPAELKRIEKKREARPAPRSTWQIITGTRAQSNQTAGAGRAGDSGLQAETVTVKVPAKAGQEGARTPVEIKIFRPAVSQSIVSLVTRRSSPDRGVQLGDQVSLSANTGGPPLLGTVTPAPNSQLAVVRSKVAPTQMPFFKVWAKGERLTPRDNRADDTAWPRPRPVVLIAPPQAELEEEPILAGGPAAIGAAGRPRAPASYLPPGWTGPPLPEQNPARF